jgi:ADP-ribosylglycohydrolase
VQIPSSITEFLPKPWNELNPREKRFVCCLVAYAAGDAFGAFYEFAEISKDIPDVMMEKKDWPVGGTSDDTSLTILTLLSLDRSEPTELAKKFLELLGANQRNLRGLGPTTRAALGLPVKEVELDSVGLTNGAMMRTALLGLIYTNSQERARVVRALSESTHKTFAVEKSIELSDLFASEDPITLKNEWKPPINGVSNEARETFLAVLYVAQMCTSVIEAMRMSCSLGGDTDTVAALSAALVVSKSEEPEEVFKINWLTKVDWNGISNIRKAIENAFSIMVDA